jgi:hypothetical protein
MQTSSAGQSAAVSQTWNDDEPQAVKHCGMDHWPPGDIEVQQVPFGKQDAVLVQDDGKGGALASRAASPSPPGTGTQVAGS